MPVVHEPCLQLGQLGPHLPALLCKTLGLCPLLLGVLAMGRTSRCKTRQTIPCLGPCRSATVQGAAPVALVRRPLAERAFAGLGTTPLAGAASFERGLSPEMASIVQALSIGAYQDFVQLVSIGRDMSPEAVEQVADGLVWTGQEAAKNGLVDGLGGLEQAVAAAASLAGVEQWRTRRTSMPPSFESLFIEELSRSLTQSVLPKGAWFQALANSLTPVVKSVSSLRDPAHLYVQCLLCAPLP